MTVFGTRPEAIKMCPVVLELKTHKDLQTVVCVTGQHREMLDQILHVFNVKPDYDLSIMKPNQTLYNITADVLIGMDAVLEKEKPDVVLVHGDTTTSFAAALACFYRQIQVGHVEAHHDRAPRLEELGREVEVALQVGDVHEVDDRIRAVVHHVVAGDHLLGRVRGERVDAREVHEGHVAVGAPRGLLLLNGDARPVAHVAVGARELVEERGLAAVWVACETDGGFSHTLPF